MRRFLQVLFGSVLAGMLLVAVVHDAAADETDAPGTKPDQKTSDQPAEKSPQPFKVPKWDVSHADAAERESKRTERWPHDYVPPKGLVLKPDIIYGSPGGRDLDLDVIMRAKLPEGTRPAIVFVHGGSWKRGDKHQFRRQAARLAEHYDIFCALIFYRLSEESKFPGPLQDCKCALRWVRSVAEQYKIDPQRVAICGGSAGAHLSSLAAATNGIAKYEGDGGHADFSSDVNLAILFNGEFDLVELARQRALGGAMKLFLGGTFEQMPDLYREASTFHRLHADYPPVLLLHGTADRCVSHKQSLAVARRLKELGVDAEVAIYEGKPHSWFNNVPDLSITVDRVEEFLQKQWGLTRIDKAP